jgi:hypothetical protein
MGSLRWWIGVAIPMVLNCLLLLLSHTPIHPYQPESELKSWFPMDRTRSAIVGVEVCHVFVNEIIAGTWYFDGDVIACLAEGLG